MKASERLLYTIAAIQLVQLKAMYTVAGSQIPEDLRNQMAKVICSAEDQLARTGVRELERP